MASGLAALLDDVAAIAKIAAASVDDVAGAAGKAGSKALARRYHSLPLFSSIFIYF